MGINTFGARGVQDPQVFEYDKTLSLPIDKSKNGDATIGSVVVVGDTFGVMVTEIGMTADEIKAEAAKRGFDPAMDLLPAGYNAPGYASVRVKGGAYKLKDVAHGSKIEAGARIYAKEQGGKVVLTNDKAGATDIGFAYQASDKASGKSDIIVVLNG